MANSQENDFILMSDSVEKKITQEFYFSALDAAENVDVYSVVKNQHELAMTTICLIVTESGFVVVGTSSCLRPEAYNWDVGKSVARRDAIAKLWSFEGYLAKNNMLLNNQRAESNAQLQKDQVI